MKTLYSIQSRYIPWNAPFENAKYILGEQAAQDYLKAEKARLGPDYEVKMVKLQ